MEDVSTIIADLEQQRDAIDRAFAALRDVGGAAGEAAPAKRRGRPPGSMKTVSADTGNKRSEGQKRRWEAKKAAGTAVATKSATKKRGLTAAGRKRLSEMMKARWASKNPPKPVARKRAAA
jgi:hypothetical protein